ncbi:sugar transferase [Blautia coccoides]|uniref:sugar transferase n=1 Tax=Blautia producta TaxID=33035 RepID=UPI0028A47465|nr:sugar transferase [Blautia coccoides]MDT4375359.1 sugar transferase [Blautia coccoides]
MYKNGLKRVFDFCCALLALIVLSPILCITALLVRTKLGSPILFTQDRPGKDEKIFKLMKFRSMTDARDEEGNLLPDDDRLPKFGRVLRSTSLDELPELFNILKGDMAVVGPRPLLIQYLPYYTQEERHRHDVRPGLTGLAQINGRNTITWKEKFAYDIEYVNNITFVNDLKIIIKTVGKVFKRSDIAVGKEFKITRFLEERANWEITPEGAIDPEGKK